MQGSNLEIKFGTDGWRGIIGDNYTFENLKIVSQAVADYLGKDKKVAVGFDTRFMSDKFAEVVAHVLSNNGIRVLLSDKPIPTPALSFVVKSKKLDLGVMITASHNPSEYNGFKIKLPSGGAAGQDVTDAIEKLLGKNPIPTTENRTLRLSPKAIFLSKELKKIDFTVDYVKFIRSFIALKKIKNKKFKVLVDAMYGSGDSFIAKILKGTNIKLDFMHNSINPSFGGLRPEPIEENLEELKMRVKKGKFDLGIALDGDADRIAAVAPNGIFIHPQKILGLLALHLIQDRHWKAHTHNRFFVFPPWQSLGHNQAKDRRTPYFHHPCSLPICQLAKLETDLESL